MYYFLSNNLPANLSGIEHAQIKRLRLFKNHQTGARIFTKRYNRILHEDIKNHGLQDSDIVGMYDWLQNAVQYENTNTGKMVDFVAPENAEIETLDNGQKNYLIDGNCLIQVLPFNFDNSKINEVHYLDNYGNVIQQDCYDSRGFISLRQFFDQNGGGVVTEQMLKPNGEIGLEMIYRKFDDGFHITSYMIPDYFNNTWFFDNEDQLTRFVLDEISLENERAGQEATYILDRAANFDHPVSWLGVKSRKFVFWHNVHTVDPTNISGQLYNSYQFELDNSDKFDGILVPTKRQADDIRKYYQPKLKVYNLPVGYNDEELLNQVKVPIANRSAHKIINIARIDEQKRLEDSINVIAAVKKDVPDVTLDIWGYVYQEDLKQKLDTQIKTLGLEDTVKFRGYASDMNKIYNGAQLEILTSRYEGNPLSIIEALGHGVPVIAYDIFYGPSDTINSGVTGYLIQEHDITGMANQIVKLFKNDAELQELSDHAYEESKTKFSAENAWEAWKRTIVR